MKDSAKHNRSIMATNVSIHSGLLFFFLSAFSICWLCLGVVVLDSRQAISLGSPLLMLGLKGLGNFGPTLSAIGLTVFLAGSPGLRSLLARSLRWRFSVIWYAIALLSPFIMVITGLELVLALSGRPLLSWSICAADALRPTGCHCGATG